VVISKSLKLSVVIIVISIIAILYRIYNPDGNIYFPKCPFRVLTGLKCPGCGSQRAVHFLLNFDIFRSLEQNALLVISIPYLLTGIAFESFNNPGEKILKWRKLLFGRKAIDIVLAIIIVFWILRNLL
jgi:hypothetical protein